MKSGFSSLRVSLSRTPVPTFSTLREAGTLSAPVPQRFTHGHAYPVPYPCPIQGQGTVGQAGQVGVFL
jgi:hypothetical protein